MQRAECNTEKSTEFARSLTPRTFGDIERHTVRRSTPLIRQYEALVIRKFPDSAGRKQGKLLRPTPRAQLLEIPHSGTIWSVLGKLLYQITAGVVFRLRADVPTWRRVSV